MTDRIYRTILGLVMLLALYFESSITIYALVVVMLLEGITRYSVPRLIGVVGDKAGIAALAYQPEPCSLHSRFNFDSELMWRMVVAALVLMTYSFNGYFWFFPWFMGFTIFGAGVSGICPVLMAIRWTGFK
jgi:hypothetical protein